jgi:hypothetical protein
MGFSSRTGRRPAEYASKSAHGHVVLDKSVQAFLTQCDLPKKADEVRLSDHGCPPFTPPATNPVTHVIAIDSGYQEVQVRKEFPSATVCFYQFGELLFAIEDLERLEASPFIDPEDMARLRNIQRRKLVLPVRNVTLQGDEHRRIRSPVSPIMTANRDSGKSVVFAPGTIPARDGAPGGADSRDGRGQTCLQGDPAGRRPRTVRPSW